MDNQEVMVKKANVTCHIFDLKVRFRSLITVDDICGFLPGADRVARETVHKKIAGNSACMIIREILQLSAGHASLKGHTRR
ncbi:hypothetical protein N7451_005255 [Penicillium sp. IBT 35674x]|nr:hypothetical protein N7451_005255 [Penicillium sp. IBT 35674x]